MIFNYFGETRVNLGFKTSNTNLVGSCPWEGLCVQSSLCYNVHRCCQTNPRVGFVFHQHVVNLLLHQGFSDLIPFHLFGTEFKL